jgi:phosphomannomutase/phosphoglucomutase
MRDLGAVFAGEMSGHMFFADEYYGYDDAIYAAGRLLRTLSRTDRPLSALAAELPRYYATPEIRVATPDDRKHQVVAALAKEFKARHEVIDIDGVRIVFPDGWGLVRASNTQPVLVVRAEGATPAALDRIKGILENALREYPEVAPIRLYPRDRGPGHRAPVPRLPVAARCCAGGLLAGGRLLDRPRSGRRRGPCTARSDGTF